MKIQFRSLSFIVPLLAAGVMIPAAWALYRLGAFRDFRNAWLHTLTLALLAAGSLGLYFSRRVGRNLSRLAEIARQVERGDMDSAIDLQSGVDEIDQVASSLNALRISLLNHSRHLDGLVREKTDHVQREVEDHRMTERMLREISETTRAILDSAHDAFIRADEKGCITFWNQQAETIFGIGRDEALGAPFANLVFPARLRESQADKHRRLAEGADAPAAEIIETVGLRRNGEEFPLEISATRVPPAGKSAAYFLRDITARRQAEQHIRHAKEAADLSNRAKTEFLANMSHEIRTPMNGIIGMAELLLDTALSAEQREFASTLKNSADTLLMIVNDVLDFSKIEAGNIEIERLPFHLEDCVGDVMRMLVPRASLKKLTLRWIVDPGVPADAVGDPGRLRQVLMNLVGNAIKFTREGSVLLKVSADDIPPDTGTEPAAARVRFAVSDTGIGIAPEKRKVIFDAFYQADGSAAREFGGTGLGLTISAQLVRRMGGEIRVESELGKGSVFSFDLPFGIPKARVTDAASWPTSLRGLRALIVDDNPTNRRILEIMLTNWGLKTALADSGDGALWAMKQAVSEGAPFDIALLDASMPVMDGFALGALIKGDSALASMSLIMLSSSGIRGDAARCQLIGFAGYLTKPIRPSELMAAMQGAVRAGAGSDARPLITRHTLREQRLTLRILLAEDNVVNQRVAAAFMEKEGHSVEKASSGTEALNRIRKESFDLLLLDVQMPGLDGFEVAAQIRKDEQESSRHLPIIATTAQLLSGDRGRCLAAGMDECIEKPLQAHRLFDAIERLTGLVRPAPGRAPRAEIQYVTWSPRSALERLAGNRNLLNKAADLFVADSPGLLADLREAINYADASAIATRAHKLKGSISVFSTLAPFEQAQRLVILARDKDLSHVPDLYIALETSVYCMRDELKDYLQQQPPANAPA